MLCFNSICQALRFTLMNKLLLDLLVISNEEYQPRPPSWV